MPEIIDFNYPRVDVAFFRRDPRRHEIPALLIERIGKGAKQLENQIKRVERDTAIRYPPAIVLPCALYDVDNHMVIDALPTRGQRGENIFLEVRFAAPTIAFADDRKLLGIAAHEFVHYVKHTIEIHQHTRGHGSSKVVTIGEVPPEVKALGIKAMDDYQTVTAKDWLCGQTLAAWQEVEQESFTKAKWAELIMKEWIRKGYPTEDRPRGRPTPPGKPGRVLQANDVIDKAKKLNLIS
jgi:hypothetical protein